MSDEFIELEVSVIHECAITVGIVTSQEAEVGVVHSLDIEDTL